MIVHDSDETLTKFAEQSKADLRRSARQFKRGKQERSRSKNVRFSTGGKSVSFQANELKLRNSIRTRLDRRRGAPADRVSIDFAYHGVFVEKGKGKGRRVAKPWFNPVLNKNLDRLADELGADFADLAVKRVEI